MTIGIKEQHLERRTVLLSSHALAANGTVQG